VFVKKEIRVIGVVGEREVKWTRRNNARWSGPRADRARQVCSSLNVWRIGRATAQWNREGYVGKLRPRRNRKCHGLKNRRWRTTQGDDRHRHTSFSDRNDGRLAPQRAGHHQTD